MSMRALSKTAPVARAYVRYASTESAPQKAAQGLTQTLCSLYKAVTGPLPAAVKAPLSKAVGFVEPVIYYSEVVFHLGKQVVARQNFSLPNKVDFAAAETQLFKVLEFVKIRNIKSIKDIPLEQWKSGAVKTFELSALFAIGEIVGRGNLIGYKH
ncbi:hypothetical protein IWQ57_000821 [Coemansia nantahalensis]|uniref:Uncharacterized protein n=2 Tax=Coemansia TaxID=4863 RepID=A0ACC1LDJ2_9FUNG|nr:hypothetical protein IWQ57_000821 [Coemansia nantahalensis]KAJ2805794.1 hypothetical protein H4R21_001123 [Coemansia helicoidea]